MQTPVVRLTSSAPVDEEEMARSVVLAHHNAAPGSVCVVVIVESTAAGAAGRWADKDLRDDLRRCVDRSLRRLVFAATEADLPEPAGICAEIHGNAAEVRFSVEFVNEGTAAVALPSGARHVATITWCRSSVSIPKSVKNMCATLWNGRWISGICKKACEGAEEPTLRTMLPGPSASITGPNAFEGYRVYDPYGGLLLENLVVAGVDDRYAYLAVVVTKPFPEGEVVASHVIAATLGVVGKVPVPALFHTSLASGSSSTIGGKRARQEETVGSVGFGDSDTIDHLATSGSPPHSWYVEFSRASSPPCGFKFRGRYDQDDSVPPHVRYLNEAVRPKKHVDARGIRWVQGARFALVIRDRQQSLPTMNTLCFAAVVKVFAEEVVTELEDLHAISVVTTSVSDFATGIDIEAALEGSLRRVLRRIRKYQAEVATAAAASSANEAKETQSGNGQQLADAAVPVDGNGGSSSGAARVLEEFLGKDGDAAADSSHPSSGPRKLSSTIDASWMHHMGERLKNDRSATFTAWNVPEYRVRLSVFTQLEKLFQEGLLLQVGAQLALSPSAVSKLEKAKGSPGKELISQLIRCHTVATRDAPLALEEGPFLEFKHHLSAQSPPTNIRGGRPSHAGGAHQADAERIRHTIAAMSSSAFGGVLIVGIRDDGEVVGHPSGEVKNILRLHGYSPAMPKDSIVIKEVTLIHHTPPAGSASTPAPAAPSAVAALMGGGGGGGDLFGASPLANLFSGLQKSSAAAASTRSTIPGRAAPQVALVVSLVFVRPGPAPFYLPTNHGYHHTTAGFHASPTTGRIPPPVMPVARGTAGNRPLPVVAALATIASFVEHQQV